MRTISWSKLREFIEAGHGNAEMPLRRWYEIARRADWPHFAAIRNDFQDADRVGERVIFNVGGNNFRLIVRPHYPTRHVYIRWIGTHAEYDRLSKWDIERL